MAASVVCSVVSLPAQALEVVQRYTASPAFQDAYGEFAGGHVIFNLLGESHINSPGTDLFWDIYDDGSAHFHGQVVQRDNAANGWTLDLRFTELPGPGTEGPKIELIDEALVENGGPVDPATWVYYAYGANTLTGFGRNAGTVLTIGDVTQGAFPLQVGYGANGKNVNFGMSSWFAAADVSTGVIVDEFADFNVDLTPVVKPSDNLPDSVPTPATGLAWLVTSGAAIARKRKEEQNNES